MYIFFIQCSRPELTGRWYYHRQKLSTFFRVFYRRHLELRYYCNRYTYEYIPQRYLWLNRLYFETSNSPEKKWLTIDIRNVNTLQPSKFRTGAENDKEQICYFNHNKKDRVFKRFLAVRKQTSGWEILFYIVSLIDKSGKSEDTYYKISNEIREFNIDRIQPKAENSRI